MSIYIDHDGRTVGPFTLEEINAKLAQGEIIASTMAWAQDAADWVPVGQISGVKSRDASLAADGIRGVQSGPQGSPLVDTSSKETHSG